MCQNRKDVNEEEKWKKMVKSLKTDRAARSHHRAVVVSDHSLHVFSFSDFIKIAFNQKIKYHNE